MNGSLIPLTLTLLLCLSGCGRQSDTNDPAQAPPPDETATEIMENPVTPPEDSIDAAAQICTPEWFAWVNAQVLALPNGKLAELYPNGLPETGSGEWFTAVDKLTGGDGAHGPDGGSAEWCSMMQQRLGIN
jgi:hypothetical protein